MPPPDQQHLIFTGKQLEEGPGSSGMRICPLPTSNVLSSPASSSRMDWGVGAVHIHSLPDQQRLIFTDKQLEDGPGSLGVHICPLLTSNILSSPASSSKMYQGVQSIHICSLLTSNILSLPANRSGMDQGARYVHICPHLTSNILSFLTSMDRGVQGIHIHHLNS